MDLTYTRTLLVFLSRRRILNREGWEPGADHGDVRDREIVEFDGMRFGVVDFFL